MGICFSIEEKPRERSACVRKNSDVSTSKFSMVSKNVDDLREAPAYSNIDIFTYEEMKYATKHFRPDLIIGEGGFGVVYKGIIDQNVRPGFKMVQVAIKELNRQGYQGDREWLTELNYLGQLSHPNLVKLIGYCCEDEHRLLVYEYMASGSLEKQLFRRVGCSPSWPKRMKIALDAAKGLAFLHGLQRAIIYRDFKTSNILLDAISMGDQTHVSTRVMGTYGYAAPEYVMTGHLTARSDVYGFGVVLLEMLIGRRVMDKSRPSREHNLVEWARPLLNHNKKLFRIMDPRMEGQYSNRAVIKVAHLAYQCLCQNPKDRPLMSQVVEMLKSVIDNDHETTMLQSEGGGLTLYEYTTDSLEAEKRSSMRSDDEIMSVRCGGRSGNARSRSELPKDLDLHCLS